MTRVNSFIIPTMVTLTMELFCTFDAKPNADTPRRLEKSVGTLARKVSTSNVPIRMHVLM